MKKDFGKKRDNLIDNLIRKGYIESKSVEKAMRKVPRHKFVPKKVKSRAYVDSPQPIGEGQTISAPHMVAMMVEKLDIEEGQKVLEIGGGMGYHAAVIAEMIGEKGKVYSIEYVSNLAESAQKRIKDTGYHNVQIIQGDGSSGYEKRAPYHRISVACGAPSIPSPLIDQLVLEGKILIPIGSKFFQKLIKATKRKENKIEKENLGGVRFVPLKGKHGF
ncbi:MAG: protein-L-isoaspartate O-methyltransferase [Candidatus Thermoplasmatota archaeon]|nr:protein-L-isoaspartate O-methyltransferase [Candidatus Thermoplasmatota archaeon]MBS3789353.1 protein-L-isoaspartate O-methyltransferase [Candidatus Thermoplasmatota archaeon]